MLVFGAILVFIIAILLRADLSDDSNTSTAEYILLALGIVMVLVSIVGFVFVCCQNKNRFFLLIYIIATIICIIGFAVLTILTLVYRTDSSTIADYCNSTDPDDVAQCEDFIIVLRQAYNCTEDDASCTETYDEDAVKDIVRNTYHSAINLAIVMAIIVLVVLICILITSCLSCRRPKDITDDTISAEVPGYKAQANVAF